MYMLWCNPPPTSIANVMAVAHPSMYVTHLPVSKEASSSHVKKVRDKLLYLAWRALPSSYVSGKPLIHQGRRISEREIRQGSDILETRGDVLISGLWYRQTGAIINFKLSNDDTDTYRFDPTEKILAWRDKKKRINMVSTATINGNIFLRSFFLLMAF